MGFLAPLAMSAVSAVTATAATVGTAAAATGGAIASGAAAAGSAIASGASAATSAATAGVGALGEAGGIAAKGVADAGGWVGKQAASVADSAYTVGKDVLKQSNEGQFADAAYKLTQKDGGGGWTKGNIEQATEKGAAALMSGGSAKQPLQIQPAQADPGNSPARAPFQQLSQSQAPTQLRGFGDYLTDAFQTRM